MTADIFAILLLLFPAITIGIICFAGKRPTWKRAGIAVAFAVVFIPFFIFMTPVHMCDKGGTQAPVIFSGICAAFLIGAMGRKALFIPLIIGFVLCSFLLDIVGFSLVHEEEYIGYTDPPYIGFENWRENFYQLPSYLYVRRARGFLARETREKPIEKLPEGWLEEVLLPAGGPELPEELKELSGSVVTSFWHTFFSGIHGFDTIPFGIWCPGGEWAACLNGLSIRHRSGSPTLSRDRELLAIDADPYKTMVVARRKVFRLGRRMPVQVLVAPKGPERLYGYPEEDCLDVLASDGRRVPFVGNPLPKDPGRFRLEKSGPGFYRFMDTIDIAKAYLLTKPGKYSVRFNGKGLERHAGPSKAVEIEIPETEAPARFDLPERLVWVLPRDWGMIFDYEVDSVGVEGGSSVRGAKATLICNLPGSHASIEIYATREKANIRPDNLGRRPVYLGARVGFHYYVLPSLSPEEAWPEYEQAIRKALLP